MGRERYPMSRRDRGLRLVLVLVASLAVSACSTLEFLYGRADWLVTEYIDGLTDLGDLQERALSARLGPVFEWHRATELPAYAALLRRADAAVSGEVDTGVALEFYDAVRARYRALADRMVGAIAPTLVTLTPEQLVYLEEALRDRSRSYAEDFAPADPGERAEKRRERVRERLEEWTGTLSDAQAAQLHELTDALPDVNLLWLEHRQVEQRRLLRLLRDSSSEAVVQAHLHRWLVARQVPPRIESATQAMRLRTADLMVAMAASLSAEQRQHMRHRIMDFMRMAERLAAET